MKYKMKQKQNQRITRISENTLVVGADIAKETHVARAIDFRGIERGKDCVFSNNRAGLEELVCFVKWNSLFGSSVFPWSDQNNSLV